MKLREFFLWLFRDDTFGPIVKVFNLTHIIALLVVISLTVFLSIFYLKKDKSKQSKLLDIMIIIIVSIYLIGFFIHPLENNEEALNVDKLPYHLCTAASLLIALSRTFKDRFKKWYHAFVILGMVGGLIYIVYPTGIDDTYLFCYRSMETFIYHSMLFMFGVLSIVFNDIEVSFKKIYFEAIVVAIQIVISILANNVYSNERHHYDWYFTTGSTFGINQYLMPFLVFFILMASCALAYGIVYLVRYINSKKLQK